MYGNQSEADWAGLSSELWQAVFSILQPGVCNGLVSETGFALREFYKLRTVCSAFASTFTEHPQLYSTMYLEGQLEGRKLDDMFKWIKSYAGRIKMLVALNYESPWLETALAGLLAFHSSHPLAHFRHVKLEGVPQTAIPLLARFSCICQCELDLSPGELHTDRHPDGLSLRAFEGLPNLVGLEVAYGHVRDLDAAAHLTRLFLNTCQAVCDENLAHVFPLIELVLWGSTIHGLHRRGLIACSTLLAICCNDSYVSASEFSDVINTCTNYTFAVPAMSTLTALTSLEISFDNSQADLQLGWLTNLPALEHLDLNCSVHALTLPMALSALHNLKDLSVRCARHVNKLVRFEFEWSKLVALKTLSISGSISSSQPFSQLAGLHALRTITISNEGLGHSDAHTTRELKLLAYKLGTERPEVRLSLS